MMSWDDYYMIIAMAVRKKANCLGRRVGALIVKENRIVATGYNGTPEGMTNCLNGGCVRCRDKKSFAPGVGYDVCICVHAEQNALITAARFGNAIEGSTVYSTMRPCFDCTKAMLQAKVEGVCYLHDWKPKEDPLREQYKMLQDKLIVRHVAIDDPESDWANNAVPADPKVKELVESLASK